MKKKISLLVAGVMLCCTTLAVSATTHECAFSYMYVKYLGENHVAYHTYQNEKKETITCEVVLDRYCDVYECACDAIEYRNYRNKVRHTERCGQ